MGGGEVDLPSGGSGVPRDSVRVGQGHKNSRFPGPYNPYAVEYNARIHGAFDPQRYYGPRKLVCWWDVKLKELPLKIFKADRSVANLKPTYMRWYNKMAAKWVRPKNAFPMFPFLGAVTVFYMFAHRYTVHWHKKAVHHW